MSKRATLATLGLLMVGTVVVILLATPLSAQEHNPAADRLPPGTGAPFAVVELFTSQGCSSCPPADAVLRRLEAERSRTGARIIGLSFHVDYWNRLGWRDPFSSPDFSARQRRYARAFGTSRIYTPQAVINGSDGLVGSDEDEVLAHVRRALTRLAPATVSLEVQRSGRTVSIHHAVNDAPLHARATVALVESGLASQVTRGENRGRRLRHDNVVRSLEERPLNGSLELTLPRGVRPERASVVLLVQTAQSRVIVGAERVAVPASTP